MRAIGFRCRPGNPDVVGVGVFWRGSIRLSGQSASGADILCAIAGKPVAWNVAVD